LPSFFFNSPRDIFEPAANYCEPQKNAAPKLFQKKMLEFSDGISDSSSIEMLPNPTLMVFFFSCKKNKKNLGYRVQEIEKATVEK
jgi:hypothetical protein